MSLFGQADFLVKPFSGFLEPHNFFYFLTRCAYIERKTPSKNILEFLKHFSTRSHHEFFDDPGRYYF